MSSLRWYIRPCPILFLSAVLFLLLLPAGCQRTPAEGELGARTRPNILFVFTDDHASQAISAYGSRINRTPNIDRLAAEGMRFENCFAGNAICAPSRATVRELTAELDRLRRLYGEEDTRD